MGFAGDVKELRRQRCVISRLKEQRQFSLHCPIMRFTELPGLAFGPSMVQS